MASLSIFNEDDVLDYYISDIMYQTMVRDIDKIINSSYQATDSVLTFNRLYLDIFSLIDEAMIPVEEFLYADSIS